MPRHIMHLLCLFQQYGVARMQLKNCSGVVHGETLFWLVFVTALLQIISLLLPSSSPVSQVIYAVHIVVLVTLPPSIQRSQFCLLVFFFCDLLKRRAIFMATLSILTKFTSDFPSSAFSELSYKPHGGTPLSFPDELVW